jgi:hypothetical protein
METYEERAAKIRGRLLGLTLAAIGELVRAEPELRSQLVSSRRIAEDVLRRSARWTDAVTGARALAEYLDALPFMPPLVRNAALDALMYEYVRDLLPDEVVNVLAEPWQILIDTGLRDRLGLER